VHLLVFDDDVGLPVYVDFMFYYFQGHQMTLPPVTVQSVASCYLVMSSGRFLMVKRFTSLGRGTMSFQVFRLGWDNNSDPYWEIEAALIGKLLFIGRGCSRVFLTGIPRAG
jgi:hypothetical protein